MIFGTHIKVALNNLFISKMRSALTILGVLIGTASVVALMSGGKLATQHALAQFKTLGTDLLAITFDYSGTKNREGLTVENLGEVAKSSPNILITAPYTLTFRELTFLGKEIQGTILGANEALKKVIKLKLQSGRFVSHLDRGMPFAVIGQEIANKMKQAGVIDPLNKQVGIGDRYLTVVGIIDPWPENLFVFSNINRSVILPIQATIDLDKNVRIRNVIMRIKRDADIDKLQVSIKSVVRKLLPGTRIFFRSAKQIIASMEKQRQTLTLFLGFLGSIALIVGGIGVMNIMLVSVVERKREIGIRMAIGAKKKDIQMMFLTEAVVLTLFGGLMGILIGEGLSFIIASFSRWGFYFYWFPPLSGFFVSALVGIFFGIYPAHKASQLNPIEALRYE